MRRKDREITDRKDMIRIMENCDVCRLAWNDEGYPYILPLNFGMEVREDTVILYFHGALEGRKYQCMQKDDRVSFEMDCSHRLAMDGEKGYCTMEYESVIGYGRLSIVPDEEKYRALCILMKHYHQEDFPFNQKSMPATKVLKLTVEGMTAKANRKRIRKKQAQPGEGGAQAKAPSGKDDARAKAPSGKDDAQAKAPFGKDDAQAVQTGSTLVFRKAEKKDIPVIAGIYEAILDREEAGETRIGWVRGIYPTEATALEALSCKTLFVCEDGGQVVAAAKIDQNQVPGYENCAWEYAPSGDQVMVLHTLVVDPAHARRGCGKAFVSFYERYAMEHNCPYLRMDTNQVNTPARVMYSRLGYREAGIIPCVFNGIPDVQLVCLEKKLA